MPLKSSDTLCGKSVDWRYIFIFLVLCIAIPVERQAGEGNLKIQNLKRRMTFDDRMGRTNDFDAHRWWLCCVSVIFGRLLFGSQ